MKKLILLMVTVIGLALSFAAIADMATDQDKQRVEQDRRELEQDRDRMRQLNEETQRHRQKLTEDQRRLEMDMRREREEHRGYNHGPQPMNTGTVMQPVTH